VTADLTVGQSVLGALAISLLLVVLHLAAPRIRKLRVSGRVGGRRLDLPPRSGSGPKYRTPRFGQHTLRGWQGTARQLVGPRHTQPLTL